MRMEVRVRSHAHTHTTRTHPHTHRDVCNRSTMKPARGEGEAVANNDPELNLDEAATHNASVRNRS